MDQVEHIFTALFTVELILRCRVYGIKIFMPHDPANFANFADAMLVIVTGIFFGWIMPILASMLGLPSESVVARTLTVLRAGRLLRLVRVIQKVQIFREVWLLIRGLTGSMMTLFWTAVV